MTYLVWDGESLFEKNGSLIQVGEDECCCITTTGSTSGSTDTETGSGSSDSGSGSSDSGSGSSDTTGYPSGSGGSAECVEDSDCCVCNYKIEKEPCSLEGCPDGWIDDGFYCVYQSEFYVNCESGGNCPAAPIDDLGDVECCQGWNEVSEGGYDGSCSSFTEESGVCCNGECEEDCCDYREEPELCDSIYNGTCTQYYTGLTGNCDYESREAAADGCEADGSSTYPEYFCYTYIGSDEDDWCYELIYREQIDPPEEDTFDSTTTEAECSCAGADGFDPGPSASTTAQELADEWCALYGYVWVASQGSCTNDTCPEELQVYDETTGETYCCPEGCPPDQEYYSDGSGYGDADGPCCCENPSGNCVCYCDCDGSFPCTEAEGGGQANCEAIGPNCGFTGESFPGAGDCGCDCGFIPTDFASVDDDCGTDNADVDSICGPGSECSTGAWGFYCVDQDD